MDMKNVSGNVSEEMKEISKFQESTPWILSMLTNTCTGITSVVCC